MLGLDGEKLELWRQKTKAEADAERRQKALQQEIDSNTITVSDDDGRDTSVFLAQMGKLMTCEEITSKLKLICPKLHFERSWQYPEKMGVYLLVGPEQTKKFLFGMESGISPEFSVRHKTIKRLPNKDVFGKNVGRDKVDWIEVPTFLDETRGWRTVLVRLIHCGLISKNDADKHFGLPSHDSKNWHQQTSIVLA